ncbi:hypothetical protein B0H17DRAFT_460041 [Mycena rosella]|uniref:Sacsin/Nov domain-containing protein n=1 Tax=Mycena rosella TaxID=1033263 RepID=A0AAD7C9T9_MYCRO|nr:hypothetical protein B0H17DRAFT_460041 [Mycena rosella]
MEVIEDIRSKNAAPGSAPWNDANPAMMATLTSLRRNLHHATQSLSEDLYASDSHFLLELVQNADDNTYGAGVIPTLHMTLGDHLVVACNETGFTEDQVRAICKIGASTKKHQQGYIGEKGIGFKSVFKVADTVFISSGPYKFSFDKHAELGMITPSFSEYCPGRQDWTQFTLQLSDTINRSELKSYLSDIDPTLLLFLRKLRALEINLGTICFVVVRKNLEPNVVRLRRRLRNGPITSSRYLLVKKMVTTYLTEKKRPNISRTEIILAFPLKPEGGPRIKDQFVHAFLPIRKYGFSFLIQGDFLTSTNREDILSDSPWNITIRDALVSVFLDAIQEFRRRPELALVWYKYIPIKIPWGFFSPFKDSLLAKLKTMDILRSADGRLRQPSQLFVVSSDYFDDNGDSLIPEEYLRGYYLSSEYDHSDGILYELGVQVLSDSEFIEALSRMSQYGIQRQSTSWQESVSALLKRLNRQGYSWPIKALRMVPLQDGSWVAPNSGDLFFSSAAVDIPGDLGLRLLARLDLTSSRYSLFSDLGIREADPGVISEKILDFHRRSWPSTGDVLSHAHYLFFHRDQLRYNLDRLYLLNREGKLANAKDLYMDGREQGIMPISDIISSRSQLLHQSYLTPPSSHSAISWHAWLKDALCVNVSPRVTDGQFSSEFVAFLTDSKSGTPHILRALKDYWPRLRSGVKFAAVKALGEKIVVICHDKDYDKLNATALYRARSAHSLIFDSCPSTIRRTNAGISWKNLVSQYDLMASCTSNGCAVSVRRAAATSKLSHPSTTNWKLGLMKMSIPL